jgi:hypothetical protein
VAQQAAIHRHYYEVLMPEERNDSLRDPDNNDHWTVFFMEHHLTELAHYKGNGPPPANKNAAAWKLWWGARQGPHPPLGPRPHRRGQLPAADNADAALAAAQDGRPGVLLLAFIFVDAVQRHHHRVAAIGAHSSPLPKEGAGIIQHV